MIPVLSPLPGTLLEDASEEALHNDILYYKAMLAEAARKTGSLRHLSPAALRQKLQDCEGRLRRLRNCRHR
ncbi:MAG: hypothetical protein AB1450_09115 [Pseudomonadota bacterium]